MGFNPIQAEFHGEGIFCHAVSDMHLPIDFHTQAGVAPDGFLPATEFSIQHSEIIYPTAHEQQPRGLEPVSSSNR